MSVSNEAEFIAAVTIGSAIEYGVYSVKYTIVTSHCTWWVEGGDLLELRCSIYAEGSCAVYCARWEEYTMSSI